MNLLHHSSRGAELTTYRRNAGREARGLRVSYDGEVGVCRWLRLASHCRYRGNWAIDVSGLGDASGKSRSVPIVFGQQFTCKSKNLLFATIGRINTVGKSPNRRVSCRGRNSALPPGTSWMVLAYLTTGRVQFPRMNPLSAGGS